MGDPVSAIIGLGASLTTLAGLVLESAKTLHAAQQHFREAPKDIARLHHQLYQFNRLLGETLKQIHSDDSGRTADMRTLIEDSAQYMRKDLEELSADIRNLKNILDTSASRSKRLRLRLRHIFTENKVARYQQLIASHTQALTLSLALVTNAKSIQPFTSIARTSRSLTKDKSISSHKLVQRTSRKLHLPFGVTIFVDTGSASRLSKKAGGVSPVSCSLTVIPPTWLSSLILRWEFGLRETSGNIPLIGLSLSPINWNTRPELLEAVRTCDAMELRKLFRSGIARPGDHIVLRRKPMLLVEAIATRTSSCAPQDVVDSYRCLLTEEPSLAEPGSAPSHAQILIQLAKSSQQVLNDALDVFCSHSGNVFWSPFKDSNTTMVAKDGANSILSLMIRHGAGLETLESFIFRQAEPWVLEDLPTIDRWLIGTLAHASPSFSAALERYFQSYRCIFGSRQGDSELLGALHINTIVWEVANCSQKLRIEFFKIITKLGTKRMLEPFFGSHLFDVDEVAANTIFPWLRLSYLSKAAKYGNEDTFCYLLEIGASPSKGLAYMSRFAGNSVPATRKKISAMILKMAQCVMLDTLDDTVGGTGNNQNAEIHFALLLRTSTLCNYFPYISQDIIKRLANHIFGKLVRSPETSNTTYLLVALLLNSPGAMQNLLCKISEETCFEALSPLSKATDPLLGLSLFDLIEPPAEGSSVTFRSNPPLGTFSWVSLAIELGFPECLEIFLQFCGSFPSSAHPSSSVVPPISTQDATAGRLLRYLRSTMINVNGLLKSDNYPRNPVRIHTWPCQVPLHPVTRQQDERIAEILQAKINTLKKHVPTEREVYNADGTRPNATSAATNPGKQRLTTFMAAASQLSQLQTWEMAMVALCYCISLLIVILHSFWAGNYHSGQI